LRLYHRYAEQQLRRGIMLDRLADWHKRTLAQVQQQLGLSTYQMHFFAFAEGIIFGLIIGWLIF